jgi:hypothetical protein
MRDSITGSAGAYKSLAEPPQVAWWRGNAPRDFRIQAGDRAT